MGPGARLARALPPLGALSSPALPPPALPGPVLRRAALLRLQPPIGNAGRPRCCATCVGGPHGAAAGGPGHHGHPAGAHPPGHSHGHATAAGQSPIAAAVASAAELLPHQGILENFVHHNPLHALENMTFQGAIDRVLELQSYRSPGKRVELLADVDPRKRASEALADLCSAFLDRGAAKWVPKFRDRGFLHFFARLEDLGPRAPWRAHARELAEKILAARIGEDGDGAAAVRFAEAIVEENLAFFGIPSQDTHRAVLAMLMDLPGWSGMFHRMETHPSEAPAGTRVIFMEYVAVQSIMQRSSMEALARHSGWNPDWQPFGEWLAQADPIRPKKQLNSVQHASAVAYLDQSSERREALENEIETSLLQAIGSKGLPPALPYGPAAAAAAATDSAASNPPLAAASPATASAAAPLPRPKLQMYTCIDDRECSLRRHVEAEDPGAIQTFGVAGFFGVPIRYRPADGRDEMVLAPEGQNPNAELVEGEERSHEGEVRAYNRRRRVVAWFAQAWERMSFSPSGSLVLSAFAPFSLARLVLTGYSPDTKQKVRDWFNRTFLPKPHTDFDLPFTADRAAALLARTFKSMGADRRWAPLVLVLGHGASSVNNPYAAAYNCGACGGREGGPNARVFARMANDPAVRAHLRDAHGIPVPDDTVFVGGAHNTTVDTVEYFDEDDIPASHAAAFAEVKGIVGRALGENALERCHRFLLAKNITTPEAALRHVWTRSIDPAEVRPELNHASNAAVVVGRRDLTKGSFFDRRVFLPSYDPGADDAAGTNLEGVLAPALIVCSGINLEYLFSTISADRHGSGTKTPLNVVGNIAVLQGTSGDLRTGLPSQMTEMHAPVRALFVVDAPTARVEAVLGRREELRRLVHNEWVRLVVRDPDTGVFYRYHDGAYSEASEHLAAPPVPLRTRYQIQREYGLRVARREALMYNASVAGMAAATVLPIWLWGPVAMNPYGMAVAACAALLSFPVLAFSKRYLHGEFMFGRFASLSAALLLGFNMVATAPSLEHTMLGWSLFGFASTFLIGSYNDRPTVRNNATFAFAAYRISDFALLTAATFAATGHQNLAVVSAGLLVAALWKSSQFPLTGLFVRSMEGPTPTSALGYAGLSAHVGVVLLAGTMPYWYPFEWARITLASLGLFTAGYSTLVAKIRSDRKGSVARATSATLGLIFVTLAAGYPAVALLMALGHAAFRMIQILRAPNVIADSQFLRAALGKMPWPRVVPDRLYRFVWALRRIDNDVHLLSVLNWIGGHLHLPSARKLSKLQQWALTAVGVVIAGAPFTPLSHGLEEWLMHTLPEHTFVAVMVMVAHFGLSVVVIRYLLTQVLSARRFRRSSALALPQALAQQKVPAPGAVAKAGDMVRPSAGPVNGTQVVDMTKAAK
ncbi:hypothetical protein DFJ74DRAFT_641843 [Hyaloraphidium curvatum]|nr:hypothetical protein DFJ74DRAFT_641843 [Hyaloraphidium curvatum]